MNVRDIEAIALDHSSTLVYAAQVREKQDVDLREPRRELLYHLAMRAAAMTILADVYGDKASIALQKVITDDSEPIILRMHAIGEIEDAEFLKKFIAGLKKSHDPDFLEKRGISHFPWDIADMYRAEGSHSQSDLIKMTDTGEMEWNIYGDHYRPLRLFYPLFRAEDVVRDEETGSWISPEKYDEELLQYLRNEYLIRKAQLRLDELQGQR